MPSISRVNQSIGYKNLSLLVAAFLAVVAAPSQGQTPAPASQVASPAYDVVSIKPNKSNSGGMSLTGVTAIFQAKNITGEDLVLSSYNLTSEKLIFGLPGWARTDHFDVDAKVVDPDMKQIERLTVDQRRGMLLAILKDRFHFQAHLETKILPFPNDPAGRSVAALPFPKPGAEPTTNHTTDPQAFVTALCGAIMRNHMESRAEVQSFDFRTLVLVEEQFPEIPTYYLTGPASTLSSPLLPPSLRQP